MDVVRWSPFRELEAMERRMRRAFEDVGVTGAAMPAADVYETESEFVVELEVPGYDEKELKIETTNHTLCITGDQTGEKEEDEKAFHLHERLEKSFERRFTLPAEADLDKAKAIFKKGVLEVHVAKAAEAKPRTVPIGK
jgi:HSP20 family protein